MQDTNRILLEVPVRSPHEAEIAARAGADRLELCESLDIGGVSPSVEVIQSTVTAVPLPVFVLVRPHGGLFCHDTGELDAMESTIREAREHGAAGVVLGVLTPDGSIDVPACRRLADAAKPLPAVFHRAFDEASDPIGALEILAELGFVRILTAGGGGARAAAQPARLAALVRAAAGRIEIMPGGGVRADNLEALRRAVPLRSVHTACRSRGPAGYGPLDAAIVRGMRVGLDRLA